MYRDDVFRQIKVVKVRVRIDSAGLSHNVRPKEAVVPLVRGMGMIKHGASGLSFELVLEPVEEESFV